MDQRVWEDHLWAAEEAGLISDRTHYIGLRLSRAMTWGTHPTLRWGGPALLAYLRISKSAYYRHLDSLHAAGLIDRSSDQISPTGGTGSPMGGTLVATTRPTDGTNRPTDGTYKKQEASEQAREDRVTPSTLTAATTAQSLIDAYRHEGTMAQYYAAVFTVGALRDWPEAERPRWTLLLRLFEEAIDRYGEDAVWHGMAEWMADARGLDARNPGGLFARQCSEYFAAHTPAVAQ